MMEELHSKKIPTPPSSRPSSLRRPRTRYVSKIQNQNANQVPMSFQESTIEKNEKEMNLQKYKILPAIASCSDLRNEHANSGNERCERSGDQDNISRNNSERSVDRESRSKNNSQKPADKSRNNSGGSHGKGDSGNRDVLDVEWDQISRNRSQRQVSECDVHEKQLELAIRSPDGNRHEICFSSSRTFRDLLQYLASSSGGDAMIPRNCEIVTSEIPRQVFLDFNVTLHEAKIKTRTLLHIREVDPD